MKPPSLFRKGYAPKLKALKINQSTLLENVSVANASRAALNAIGAGKYRCIKEDKGVRVWRLG